MSPSVHATLSPSSAERWIHCPPSALLNANAANRETVFTREGTLAHALCELKGRRRLLEQISAQKYTAEVKKLKADPLWQEEMEGYTDSWIDALRVAAEAYERPYIALEQKVDLAPYVPEGFGTADCILIGGGTLEVIDFKYGKGVAVSAEENPQLMLYALGALLEYDPIYDLRTVRMTIVQPRIREEPDSWEVHAGDLMTWAKEVVAPAAKQAAAGEGEYAEGDWCRWCAVKGSCRARAKANLALADAKMDFKPPATLTEEEISEALTLGRHLKSWLSDVEEYAMQCCLNGKPVPGYKVVAGRSVRSWTDQDAAFAAAVAAGVPEPMLYERKPVTLAQLEKTMGKAIFAETLSGFVETPPGKPTLVPESDKRQAIDRPSAADDFTTDNLDD